MNEQSPYNKFEEVYRDVYKAALHEANQKALERGRKLEDLKSAKFKRKKSIKKTEELLRKTEHARDLLIEVRDLRMSLTSEEYTIKGKIRGSSLHLQKYVLRQPGPQLPGMYKTVGVQDGLPLSSETAEALYQRYYPVLFNLIEQTVKIAGYPPTHSK